MPDPDYGWPGDLTVSGKIGIGTLEPDARLDVKGNIKLNDGVAIGSFSDDATFASASNQSVPTTLAVQNYVNTQVAAASTGLATKAERGGALDQDFQANNLSVQDALTVTGNVSIGSPSSSPTARLSVDGTVIATAFEGNGADLSGVARLAGANTMTGLLTIQNALTATGNVTIGTTATPATLRVNGAITPAFGNSGGIMFPTDPAGGGGDAAWMRYFARTGEACTLEIGIANDPNDHLSLLASGGVSIGNGIPDRALTIQGGGNTYMNVKANNGTQEVLLGAETGGGIVSTMTNHDLQLRAGRNTTHMVIKANGNVGIGITAPNAKLHVAGSLQAESIYVTGSLQTGNLRVSGSTTLSQQDWQAPTLQNGWVRYNNTFNPPGYFKDSVGIVHLRGLVRSGTVGAAIFTLPNGYRPQFQELFSTSKSPNAYARVDVTAAGLVLATTGSNDWLSLDGITFRAVPELRIRDFVDTTIPGIPKDFINTIPKDLLQ